MNPSKPVIGISCGDLNGIGIEFIIKTFSDNRIFEHCTPVIFASNKAINFYRKSVPEINFNYLSTTQHINQGENAFALSNIELLPVGTYIMKVTINGQMAVRKIIKG